MISFDNVWNQARATDLELDELRRAAKSKHSTVASFVHTCQCSGRVLMVQAVGDRTNIAELASDGGMVSNPVPPTEPKKEKDEREMIKLNGSGHVMKVVAGDQLEAMTESGWELVAVIGATTMMPLANIPCPGPQKDEHGYEQPCSHVSYGTCHQTIEISQTPWGHAMYLIAKTHESAIRDMKHRAENAEFEKRKMEKERDEAIEQWKIADQNTETWKDHHHRKTEQIRDLEIAKHKVEEDLGKVRKHFGDKSFKEALGQDDG